MNESSTCLTHELQFQLLVWQDCETWNAVDADLNVPNHSFNGLGNINLAWIKRQKGVACYGTRSDSCTTAVATAGDSGCRLQALDGKRKRIEVGFALSPTFD